MAPSRDSAGRGGRRRTQISQMEGERDDDYRIRRERNNEAVRKSRDKSKKKTEETLQRVEVLKMENCKLEEQIRLYRKQLTKLKGVFLTHAANGNVDANIDLESILSETDIDAEPQTSSPHSQAPLD